ncbi:MAG: hypothetical protein ACI37S_06820 [Candidatus Gastranaerophilaceae bacterium]
MKINLNLFNSVKTPNFKGFNYKKSETGTKEYEFNYPHDSSKYDCYLEVFSLKKDKNDNYNVNKILTNTDTGTTSVKIDNRGLKIDMGFAYDELDNKEPFAYRYKLVDKKDNSKSFYRVDAGAVLDYSKNGNYDKFNVVTQNGTQVSKGGSMTLAIPDSYSAGWVYDESGKPKLDKNIQERAKAANRTFSNKIGGGLAGLEANIDRIKQGGYTRIVATPIFTDDSLSSHSYWNKNCMQMTDGIGNIDNYATFQQKLFKNGINFVSDGAFVNEGLEGVHFKHMLKWGEKSPYYNWFRANGLQSGPLSMGIFAKNKDYVEHKIVNSPYKYEQDSNGQIRISKNSEYDSKMPTFVQIYDSRLVSEADKKDTKKLIKSYEKTDTGNAYDINNHNDTVIPYSFEINPDTYNKNIKNLNEYNKNAEHKIMLNQPLAAKFLTQSESYVLEDKYENGFETWDANTDIAKLNFVFSHADTKRLENLPKHEKEYQTNVIKAKNFEAQDYVINSGKFWTRKTNEILNEYVAHTLKNVSSDSKEAMETINKLTSNGELPANDSINETVVANVLNGDYETKTSNLTDDYKELTLKSIMDLPLDSIEFADDTTAVLGSSLVTNRATKADEIGMSRYDLYKEGNPQITAENKDTYRNAEKLFTEDLYAFTNDVMQSVNKKLGGTLFEGNKVTKLGKYVLPLVNQDIAKYAVIKSVAPKANVRVKEDGNVSYDYSKMKEETTLASMGILAVSPKDEADQLIKHIKSGVKNISAKDKEFITNAVVKRLEGLNENSFALAEMIVDRNDAGLDWRIDAAKDIADMDALRNSNANFKDEWASVVDFWKNFTNGVLDENKNAYIIAEITDEYALHDKSGKYSTAKDAVMKLHQQTGMTTIANYSYFFTDLANIFNKDITTGTTLDKNARERKIFDKMVGGDNYLNSAPLDSILYSYTFVGNHDKPRMLHCLSLDMGLFHTKFDENENHKKIATAILKDKMYDQVTSDDIKSIDFDKVSNKAIAMADAVKGGFGKALSKVFNGERKNEAFSAISKSIADMAAGKYLDKEFSADAFGTKPFDVTIKAVMTQAEKKHGLNLSKEEKSKLFNATFESILKPSMSKFKAMMGFLVSLPGNPTMFAGDEIGMTGYEEKAKNVYIQNRNPIHWEWLNDENKQFIKKFNKEMNEIMALRKRPELQPLNDGTPYTLDLHKDVNSGSPVAAILRQSSNGAMAISLFNANNVDFNKEASFVPTAVKLDSISLHTTNNDKVGLKAGLKVGTTFKNADERDGSVYKVCEDKGNYFIKRFDNEQDYQYFLNNGKRFSDKNRIDMYNSSLILYSVPENKKSKVMYNRQFNFATNPYKTAKPAETGSKLAVLAK